MGTSPPLASSAGTEQKAPRIGNLTNPIHPVFCRANFDNGEDTDSDYAYMTAALQLASRFISRPTPLSIWYTLLCSNDFKLEKYVIRPLVLKQDDYADTIHHFGFQKHSSDLIESQIEEAEKTLVSLAKHVRFEINGDDCPNAVYPDYNDGGEDIVVINLPREKIAELTKAGDRQAQGGSSDEEYYQLTSFVLAVTLCHELAHAAVMSLYGPLDYFYLPGCAVSEDGFAWEAEIFGGVIESHIVPTGAHGPDSDEELEAYIVAWPSPRKAAAYLRSNSRIGIRLEHSDDVLPRNRKPGSDNTWKRFIHGYWIHKLFGDHFWQTTVVKRGPEALKPALAIDREETILKIGRKDLETLAETYRNAKYTLEKQAELITNNDRLSDFRDSCEPWEELLASVDSDEMDIDPNERETP